ncbi:hypothetical protein D9M68_679170 [compost metagenome]
MEGHADPPVIEIAGIVQQVDLQVGAPVALDAGTYADVGDARQLLVVQLHAHQVHAVERYAAALELHIRGRGAQLAAELLAVQHSPGNAEGAAQQALGEGEVARGQGLAHPRAADPLAIQLHGSRGFDAEALGLAGLQEEGEIAGTIATEAEIVTDLQVRRSQPFNQHRVDELRGAELAQAAVERQAEHLVHALARQQLELVAQARQAHRRCIRAEVLARLRLENHHATGQTQLSRTLAQPLENGLVAAVHAVEIADGGDAAPMLGLQVV